MARRSSFHKGRGHGRRGRASAALVLAALVLLTVGTVAANSQCPAPKEPGDWAMEDWVAWRDMQIAAVLAPSNFRGESLVVRGDVAERCAAALRTIEVALSGNPRLLAPDTETGKALGNFVAFVRAQALSAKEGGGSKRRLGLDVSDVQYWASSSGKVSLPDLLASQEFLRCVSHREGYADAVAMIEDRNKGLPDSQKWAVLPFEAQFVRSVDRRTFGRLLVMVPGEQGADGRRYDKWVTFAIATPEQDPAPDLLSVSIVSVQLPEKADGAPHVFFMDYLRSRRGEEIALMPTAAMPDNPSKNCYDCHKSGVLPIRPEREFGFDSSGSLVPSADAADDVLGSLNKKIGSYGRCVYDHMDTAAYGPSLGPTSSDGRERLVSSMVSGAGIGDESVERIASQMKCAGCHNDFAPLNYPEPVRTDRDVESMRHGRGLAQTFVEEGWMPPGNTLSPQERKVLWKCLSREYFDPATREGTLVDWLRGK
ncbi:MAG TPA: hypothetical protein VNI20_11445 [Fimbriimonadaceae bacterium]|nr:hypothetical protein [Fimbriimonadaceae bacterium]